MNDTAETIDQTDRPAGHPGYCICPACCDWRRNTGYVVEPPKVAEPPAPPPVAPQPVAARPTGGMLAVFGAIGTALISLLLPWFTVTAPFLGRITIAGLETQDGRIIGGGLLLLGLLALAEHRTPRRGFRVWLVVGFACLMLAIAYEYGDAAKRIADLNDGDFGVATIGTGFYLCAASGIAGLVGALKRFSDVTR